MRQQPHQLQVQPIGQPPTNGAVDLATLKTAPPEAIAEAWRQTLIGAQLVCQCGERFYEEMYVIQIRRDGTIASPVGSLPGLGVITIHSLECPIFYQLLNTPEMEVLAVRRQKIEPPIEWWDEFSPTIIAELKARAAAVFAAAMAVEAAQQT